MGHVGEALLFYTLSLASDSTDDADIHVSATR